MPCLRKSHRIQSAVSGSATPSFAANKAPPGKEMWAKFPLVFVIALAAIVGAALYVTYRLVDPLPPRLLVIAAGVPGSGYDNFARQYARILARHGVEPEIRYSAGAVENLELLRDPRRPRAHLAATWPLSKFSGNRSEPCNDIGPAWCIGDLLLDGVDPLISVDPHPRRYDLTPRET